MTDQQDYFSLNDDLTSAKSKTIRGSIYTGAGQILRVGVSFLSQIVLGHLLSPQDFGLIAMVGPITAILELLKDLGISQAVISTQVLRREEVNSLYWVGLTLSLLAALVLTVVSPIVAALYKQPAVCPIMIALAAQMPIASLAGHASALMARKMRFAQIVVVDLLGAIATLISTVLAALVGARYWALVIGLAVGSIIRAVFDLWLSGWRPGKPQWTGSTLGLLRFGGQLTSFNLISYCSSYFDNIAVGFISGPIALGLFDRSFSLVLRPLSSITAPISKVAVPLLSATRRDTYLYKSSYLTMLSGLLFIGSPILLVLALFPHEIIGLLLGRRWAPMSTMFSAISIAALFTPFSGSSYWLFASQNRASEQIRVGLFSSGMVLLALVVAIHWGPNGIAIAYALFAPVVHGSYSWIAGRVGPVRRRDIFSASFPYIIAAPCIVGLCLALKSLLDGSLGVILFAVALSYILQLLIAAMFPSQRKMALSLLAS